MWETGDTVAVERVVMWQPGCTVAAEWVIVGADV